MLVVSESNVYVYELMTDASTVRLVASVRCAANVLAVSMDASSGWYAIGALLERRQGVCIDLTPVSRNKQFNGEGTGSFALGMNAEVTDSTPAGQGSRGTILAAVPSIGQASSVEQAEQAPLSTSTPQFLASNTHVNNDSTGPGIQVASSYQFSPVRPWLDATVDSSNTALRDESWSYIQDKLAPGLSALQDLGERATFRNICSRSDPPLSVAICPHKRCVAFGARIGIELHWVDGLTVRFPSS